MTSPAAATVTAATIAAYDARAAEYGRFSDRLHELAELEAFAATLPPRGRVLDLGCGPGFYAGWLAQAGFRVDALDASREMVALAAARPGVTPRQARFDEVTEQALYDGIWANFSLLHAPRADFPGHLQRLKRAGRAGVVLHLGMKLGEGEGADRLGRFYAYYSEAELEAELNNAGFSIDARRTGSGPGLAGNIEPFILIRAHG